MEMILTYSFFFFNNTLRSSDGDQRSNSSNFWTRVAFQLPKDAQWGTFKEQPVNRHSPDPTPSAPCSLNAALSTGWGGGGHSARVYVKGTRLPFGGTYSPDGQENSTEGFERSSAGGGKKKKSLALGDAKKLNKQLCKQATTTR